MKNLPKAYTPKEVEDKWYSFWKKNNFFHADENSLKKPFCIAMPPPNVTGVLHMGHALDGTIQDILIRYKRMCGFEALWIPGTDHAGISTQTVIEKHLLATQGKKRADFSREELLAIGWKWKEEKEKHILSQIAKLGASCDWSRLRFTMDDQSNRAVRILFKRLFDEGLIYRGDYLIHWDPVTQTALSDDEVEYEEKNSFLWYFRYPLVGSKKRIVIATTRPETMLGDTAVAVSPDDPRYASFIGKEILLPLMERPIPIIADPMVDPSFGTGAVKITPAHDFNDYEIALRHSLPMINILTPDGHINANGKEFCGLTISECREAVVRRMQNLGLLEKIEPHKLNAAVSYRSKATVEPYLSKQWFVKMTAFKQTLIDAVKTKKVTLIPSYWEETYFYWIENLRDWCISRQLWWGHRIPIWYHKKDPQKMICYDGEDLPPEVKKHPDDYRQDEDVLDTWFSSALWPFSTLGWPKKTKDLQRFYPTSVLVTGHDILFFWVARMIFMGEYALHNVPFHKVFLHGLIYGKSYWKQDKEGSVTYLSSQEKRRYDLGEEPPSNIFFRWEKMSKSKGNVLDPIEIIEEYGTDAMRLALCASVTHARQIDLDRRRFEEYKNFANKIWNGSRFILMNLAGEEAPLSKEALGQGLSFSLFTLEDRWILSLLHRTLQELNRCLEEFTFDRAATLFYDFFWNDFCSHYLELVKPFLFGKIGSAEQRENKQKLLLILLTTLMTALHPIAPFLTEEIFSLLKNHFAGVRAMQNIDTPTAQTILALQAPACMMAPYPQPFSPNEISPNAEEEFSFLLRIVQFVRNIRAEMNIPLADKVDLLLFGLPQDPRFLLVQKQHHLIAALVKIHPIQFTSDPQKLLAKGATILIDHLKLLIPISQDLLDKEKVRLLKEKEKIEKSMEISRCKLESKDFVERAPPSIVQREKDLLHTWEANYQEIQKKLSHL